MATKSIRYTRMYRTCRWRWIRYVHYESTINQTRVLPVISVNDWSARVASRTSRRFVSHARFSQRDSYKAIYLSNILSFLLFIFSTWNNEYRYKNVRTFTFFAFIFYMEELCKGWNKKSIYIFFLNYFHIEPPLIIPYSPPIGNKPDVRPHFHYKSRIHLVHA